MGGFVDTRFTELRGELDKYGFRDMLSYDSMDLVLQLFTDWKQKSLALSRVTQEAEYFSGIVEELEEGVAPFKEENIRLIKENSQLRLAILHAKEKASDSILGSKSRIHDLECENDDLKLLVKQFVSRTKALEFESLEKSNKISLLLERNSEPTVVHSGKDGRKKRCPIKKQKMDLKNPVQFVCPHCVRIRNYVEYGKKYKDPTILDFAKLSDSRIEALQIQNRNLKTNQNELNEAISLLKKKIDGRESEIDKLRGIIEVKPGRVTSATTEKGRENGYDRELHLALKAAQMQLDILQSRNLQLEKKLQASILDEHSKFMNNAMFSKGMNRDLLESYVDLEAAGFPTHDKMTLEEKVRLLEAQLSHCCKDKAKLKLLLEECENRHNRRATTPVRSSRSRQNEIVERDTGSKSVKAILSAPGHGHGGKSDKRSRSAKDTTSILNKVSRFFEDSGTELSEYDDDDLDADAAYDRSRPRQKAANGIVKKGSSAKTKLTRSSSTGPVGPRPPWRAGVSMNDHSRPSSARLEAGKSREKLLKSHSQNRYSSTLDKVARSRSQKPSLEKVSSTSIGRKSSLRKRSSSTQQSKTLKFKESKGRTDTSDQERNETAQVNQDQFSNNEQSSDYTDNDDDVPDVQSRTQSSASVKIDSRQETAQEPFRGSKSKSGNRLVRTATPEQENFSEDEISERDTEDDTLPQLSTKTSAGSKGQNGRRLVSTVESKLGKDTLMPNPKQSSSKGNTRQVSSVKSRREKFFRREDTRQVSPVKSRREENVRREDVHREQSVRREDARQVSPDKSRREENVRREDARQVSPVKSRREENVRREDTRQVSPVKTRREENVPREDIHDSRSGPSQRQIQESASNLTQKMSRKSASRNQSREEIPGRPGPPVDESDQTKSQLRASGSSKSVNVLASDAPKADKFSEDEISVRDTDTDTEGESLSEMSRKTSAVLQGQRERRFGSLVESNQGEETYPKRPSSKDRSRKDSPVKSRREENIRREDTHENRSESSQRQIQEFASNRAPRASAENVSRNQSRQEFPGRSGQPLDESNRKKSQQSSSGSSKSVHGFAPPEAPEPDDFSEDEISVRDIDAETDSLPQMSRKTSAELQGQHGRRLGSIFGSQQRKSTLLPNPKQPSSQGSTRQVSPVKSRREENIRREDTHESRSGSNQRQIQESASNLVQKTSSKYVSRNQSRQDFPGPSGPPLDESSQTKPAPVRETKEVEIPDEPPKVKRKPAGSTKSMIESIPGFPSFTGKETIPPEEPVEPHRLTRETSDALQGQHGPRLKDQFQQYNLESQNKPFQFPVTRSKGKDIALGKSTTESTLLHAYGVDRGKSQNPAVRNRDPWDVLSEKQEDLRTPSDKYEVSPPRGMLSSEDDRDRMREILPGRSITRTILSGDASPLFPGRGPGQSDWITLNSDVESYRREIERLRNLMLRKEDEADELVKENEVLERRMKTMQSELSARREDTPLAFQAAMKRLEEERDFLQNNLRTSQTRTRELERQLTSLQGLNEETRSLQTRLRDLEMMLERAKLDLKEGDTQRLNLEQQIRQLAKDLTESQGDAQRWRQEAQRTRDGLEETERLLTEVQRRQTAALTVPQRDSYDLTQQYQRLATREQSLEREILSLKSGLKALDRDKDDMRIELDRKDERLAKYQSEVEQYKMDLSNLQLRLKNSELQLSHTGETNREQERETIVFRRQTESLRRDLDLVTKERDDSLNQLRKIMKTHSLSEVERRSMSSELDKRNKETDELKKQLQKYIDEVRRIEDLLMRKEEEYDLILDQYRALTAEHSSLESQRNSLEREADTIRREVRETVGQNATLKSKITTQSSLCASYEDEIERLSQQIAALETQLSSLSSAERTLQNESTSTRDLCLKLEANLDKTRLELANSTSAQNRLEAENKQLRAQVETMDAELSGQTENYNRLEELIGKSREKEFSVQRSVQELTAERDEQSRTATLLNVRTESLNQEVSKYRLRCTELQAELDRARRQLLSEMSERENAVSELRKLQDQLNTSSTNFLLGSSTFTSRDSRSVSPSPQASGGRDIPRLRTTDPGNRIISPLAAMQSHSLSRSFSPDPDVQTDSPLGMSTARGENPSKDQRSTHD